MQNGKAGKKGTTGKQLMLKNELLLLLLLLRKILSPPFKVSKG